MTRKHDLHTTLLCLVVGMFISLLVSMSLLGYTAFRTTNAEHRYEILQEDYTRKIQNIQRDTDIRIGRLQEQMNSLQFSSSKRIELLEEQVRMYRNETRKPR